MSNLQGWNLTGRLIAKHFGALGSSLASMIANFDPETATEADRDNLAATLRDVATKYAKAKIAFEKEAKDVTELKTQIANDENVAAALVDRLTAGQIDEATATLFCEELEAAKSRLPQEVQEETEARAFMDEVKSIVDEMSDRLSKFDAVAARARREAASAQAQVDLQRTRQDQQADLRTLRGEAGGSSSALGALQKRAADLRAQAEGMKVVTDVTNKPADDKAKLDALRKSVATGTVGTPSVADRLKALAAAKQPA